MLCTGQWVHTVREDKGSFDMESPAVPSGILNHSSRHGRLLLQERVLLVSGPLGDQESTGHCQSMEAAGGLYHVTSLVKNVESVRTVTLCGPHREGLSAHLPRILTFWVHAEL